MRAKLAYTVAEAAAACGVSPDVIRRAIRASDLVATYPTSRPVIQDQHLREWLESRPNEAATA